MAVARHARVNWRNFPSHESRHAKVDRDPRACVLCGVCDCTWAYVPPGLPGLRAKPQYRCDECRPASGNPLVDEVEVAA